MRLLFYGDPHGEWGLLRVTCRDERPDAVVVVGDLELDRPLVETTASVFEAGIPVWWIPGNHDHEPSQRYDRLWTAHPDRCLHGTTAHLGGLMVAGLGGVFKGRIWYPTTGEEPANIRSRAEFLASLPHQRRWRRGLPLEFRDTIFPADVDALASQHVDVLVTHEAPTSHHLGFAAIDRAASLCRARLVVHGHHHHSYEGALADGTRVKGLTKAEVYRVSPEDVASQG